MICVKTWSRCSWTTNTTCAPYGPPYPGVADAEAALEQAQAVVDELLEQVRAQRAQLGSKTVDPALTSQLAAARGAVKRARQARRDAIADVGEAATRQRQERTARLRADEKRL